MNISSFVSLGIPKKCIFTLLNILPSTVDLSYFLSLILPSVFIELNYFGIRSCLGVNKYLINFAGAGKRFHFSLSIYTIQTFALFKIIEIISSTCRFEITPVLILVLMLIVNTKNRYLLFCLFYSSLFRSYWRLMESSLKQLLGSTKSQSTLLPYQVQCIWRMSWSTYQLDMGVAKS